jgi:hypothetical protein
MAHPERAIVVHPVQWQLIIFVEVVAGERTSEETVASTMRFCAEVGLRAIRVRKEIPGFLWNRVWFALLREMLHLFGRIELERLCRDQCMPPALICSLPSVEGIDEVDTTETGQAAFRQSLLPVLATDRGAAEVRSGSRSAPGSSAGHAGPGTQTRPRRPCMWRSA